MLLQKTQHIQEEQNGNFQILKSDNLVIGGYASIEIVDKQNDLITLAALKEAVVKYMEEKKFRNVMSNHSNVQVGEVIEKYRDKNGNLHKTEVDDVGFYVVIKMRDDIEKAKEISRGIRKGTLRSFSIGGQAISKKQKNNSEFGQYNEIDKLELHEVTICEKGINPEAKFDILKMEEKEMSEKLEKALGELNDLVSQINGIGKEDDVRKEAEYMDTDSEDEDMDLDMEDEGGAEDLELSDDDESVDEDSEAKALDEDETREFEAGEEVVSGGKPTSAPAALGNVNKGLEASDFPTLNLSAENVEKAYEQFKAEQLEKRAIDELQKTFANRLEEELALKKSEAERAEYDARNDVSALKKEFAELRKSLSEKDNEIRKAKEVAFELPEGIPTDTATAAEVSWDDIHNFARNYRSD